MRKTLISGFLLAIVLVMSAAVDAQTTRRKSIPIPAPTATPQSSEPMVISRADEFPDEGSVAIPPDPNEGRTAGADRTSVQSLEDLGKRIKNLEAASQPGKPDPDAKQKRLLLNLDILSKAEERSESLRRQIFELMEKETSIRTKIDSLDYNLRPEAIERTTAITGSLRPEELRANRQKSLESEKANLQTMLVEIQKSKASLEISLQRADALVEKIRAKLDKEIDTALGDDTNNDPEN